MLASLAVTGQANANTGEPVKQIQVSDLQVDGLTNPLGIDNTAPGLSWQISGGDGPTVQTAYEVRAATSPGPLASQQQDIWDSGKVSSGLSSWVKYAGPALKSGERVYWQVRVWTAQGPSQWSSPAWWEMGLLQPGDWTAKWIEYPGWKQTTDGSSSVTTANATPYPVFAKTFTVTGNPAKARLYITGLGMEAATINGRPVGDAVLEPGVTDYNTEVQYRTYDVSSLLREGTNTIEIGTGSGQYLRPDPVRGGDRYSCPFCGNNGETGPPRAIAQLQIGYASGKQQVVGSGPDWLTALGPTTFASWYGGEDYKAARAVQLARAMTGTPASAGWTDAVPSPLSSTTTPRATTPLPANPRPPVEVVAHMYPVKVTTPAPGTYVFDFGKNFSGWPLLQLSSPKANQTIAVFPAEELNANGEADQSSMISVGLWGNTRYDYTTTDAANQTWHPSYAYSGFRYLQVTGLASPPARDTVTALQLRAGNEPASGFSSSSALLNQVDSLTRNAEAANMESVMTDCPDREKGPYTGDAMQDITNELNDFDMRAYMRAEVRNFADAQLANGEVPATGPQWIQGDDGTNWGGAIVGVPWALYQDYGDTTTLRTYYPNMQRYLAYVGTHASGYLLPDSYGLPDWETSDTASTPVGYLNSYGYYVQAKDLAQIAGVLGYTADEKTYGQLAQNIAAAFNDKYLASATHTYSTGTQAADALALDAGLVPANERQAVLNHLLATINADGGLIKVGSVSLAPIIQVLHETGNDDVLYRWATSTAYPSYGYILGIGNTTMTENWDGKPNSDGESLDHHFLGGIDAWFTFGLAGIGQAPGSIAYQEPLIKPAVVAGLSHAGGDYRSLHGTIESNWNLSGPASNPAGLTMNIAIPGSSPGTVEVPLLGAQRQIKEDGHVVWDAGHPAPGVTATADGGYIAFSGIAGQHTFDWTG